MSSILVHYRHSYVAIASVIFLLVGGCAEPPKTRQWTEDVLLDDGSTIVVKRSVTFRETNSWSGDAYNAVERDATLAFTGELANLPRWQAPLMALLLYRDSATNEWVIVGTTTSCDQWNLLGAPRVLYLPDRPNTMYWEYRLGQGGWYEAQISRASIGRPVNLLHRYQRDLGTDHVTVALRQGIESDPGIGERFASILELPKVNCMVSIENVQRRAGRHTTNDNSPSKRE